VQGGKEKEMGSYARFRASGGLYKVGTGREIEGAAE
jgi:hypothetical protein